MNIEIIEFGRFGKWNIFIDLFKLRLYFMFKNLLLIGWIIRIKMFNEKSFNLIIDGIVVICFKSV